MEELIRKNILPRLDDIEAGLYELREVTWPVCQAQRDDSSPFKFIREKKRFLRWLPLDEIKHLLRRKGILMGISQDLVAQELQEILVEGFPLVGGVAPSCHQCGARLLSIP
jgi:hypothetical protein